MSDRCSSGNKSVIQSQIVVIGGTQSGIPVTQVSVMVLSVAYQSDRYQ